MKKNYLDYIPVINKNNKWNIIEDDIVQINVINKGFFNRIAQIFFKRPKVSKIRLDEYGSIVWKYIDGNKSINEIADSVRIDFDDKFNDEDEVFYRKLVKFIHILKENKFITYKK